MSRNSNPDPVAPEQREPRPESPTPDELRALALGYLARREYAARELAAKLMHKWAAAPGIGERVEECIACLTAEGALSEARYAEAFVRARRRRGQGPVKIRAELQQRRVDAGVIAQHLDEAEAGWIQDAVDWLERQRATVTERSDRARWYRRLLGRGYSHDLALTALDRLIRRRTAEHPGDS